MKIGPEQEYLGDGVYVSYDNNIDIVTLTTENGVDVTNLIVLESATIRNLLNFLKCCHS